MFETMNKALLQKNSPLSLGALHGLVCTLGTLVVSSVCPSRSLRTQAQATAFAPCFLHLLVFAPLLQFLHVHHATCRHLERIILQKAHSREMRRTTAAQLV